MIKHTLTQEDIDNNPSLAEKGLKVGDTVNIAEDSITSGDEQQTEGDDTGGSNPSSGGRPDKP